MRILDASADAADLGVNDPQAPALPGAWRANSRRQGPERAAADRQHTEQGFSTEGSDLFSVVNVDKELT